MRTIKYFTIIVGVAGLMMLMAGLAEAITYTATGNPGDTKQGTVITAESTSASLEYTDTNANPKPTVNPADDIEVTVLPVYGFSMAAIGSQSLGVGQLVTRETYITPEGNNDSDTYTITLEADFSNDGAGTWTVNIRESDGDALIVQLVDGGTTTYTTSEDIAEDGEFGFYHEVTAPTSEGAGGGAPDDEVVITTTAKTTAEPVGQYTGANGLTYGGTSEVISVSTYSISKPVMIVTRTSTVDAPKAGAGYSGTGTDIHDKVPGSCITYTITHSNEGNESAKNVILIDKIPNNATLGHVNENDDTSYVDITAAVGDAIGWTVSYTTEASPDMTYEAGSWILIGILTTGAEVFPDASLWENTDSQFGATYIKWEKATVATTEDNKTLTWGVVIR